MRDKISFLGYICHKRNTFTCKLSTLYYFLLLTFLYFSVIFSLQCKCAHFLTILELRNCTEVCTSMLTSVKTYLITFQNEINYKHLQNRYRLSIFLIDLLFPVRLITTSRWTPKFPEMGQSFYLSLHQLFSFHWNSPCSLFIMISRWCSDSPSGSLLKIPFLECSILKERPFLRNLLNRQHSCPSVPCRMKTSNNRSIKQAKGFILGTCLGWLYQRWLQRCVPVRRLI